MAFVISCVLGFQAHLLTTLINSLSFSSPACLSLSLASASLPFKMGSSNRFLNSWAVPVWGGQDKDKKDGIDISDKCKIPWHVFQSRAHCHLPRMPALTKCTRLKYSSRSFWIGVPDMSTLRWELIALRAWYVWLSEFLSR